MPFEFTQSMRPGVLDFAQDPVRPAPDKPFLDTLGSAAQVNGELTAIYQMFNEPDFEPDPEFNLGERLKRSPWFGSHPRAFVGVNSEAEFAAVEGKLSRDRTARADLSAAGWSGVIASLAVEVTNPTNYIPFLGIGARGLKGAKLTAGFIADAAGATVLQESLLQNAQPGRTLEEGLTNISMAAVAGGAFGAVFGAFTGRASRAMQPEQLATLRRTFEKDLEVTAESGTKLSAAPVGSSNAGAAVSFPYEGAGPVAGIKTPFGTVGFGALGRVTSPIVRLADNKFFPSFAVAGPLIGTAGLFYEKNAPTPKNLTGISAVPGGSISSRITVRTGVGLRESVIIEDQYARLVTGHGGFVARTASRAKSLVGQQGSNIPSLSEFRQKLGEALNSGDVSDIPEIENAAQHIREKIYEPFKDELVRTGLLKDADLQEEALKGSASYLNRMWNTVVIKQRPTEFLDMLEREQLKKLESALEKKVAKFRKFEADSEQLASDLSISDDAARKELIRELEDERRALLSSGNPAAEAVDTASTLRALARGKDPDTAAALRQRAKDAEKIEGVKDVKKTRAVINKRLAALKRSYIGLENRRAAKLAEIDKLENTIFTAYERIIRRGQQTLRKLDKLTNEQLDAELSRLGKMLSDAIRVHNAGETRLVKLADAEDPLTNGLIKTLEDSGVTPHLNVRLTEKQGKILGADFSGISGPKRNPTLTLKTEKARAAFLERLWKMESEVKGAQKKRLQELGQRIEAHQFKALPNPNTKATALRSRQSKRLLRVDKLVKRLDAVHNFDRGEARALINDTLTAAVELTARQQQVRYARLEKMRLRAEALDPENARNAVRSLEETVAAKRERLVESVRKEAADTFDLEQGTADFRDIARERAIATMDRLTGVSHGLPGLEMAADPNPLKRGPELARVLDIPFETAKPWLELDAEKVTRNYVRTVAADISIAERLGDPNGASIINRALKDREATIVKILENPALSDAEKNAEIGKVVKSFNELQKDFSALISRLRHTRGLPNDADSIAYRMGQAVLNLNVIRLMGMVVPSSIPDMGRPIMKHGMRRVFGDGLRLLMTNLKASGALSAQVRLAGTALDLVASTRAQLMSDITDDIGRRSLPERALTYAANNMGVWSLMNVWNSTLKQASGALTILRVIDNVDQVMKGTISNYERRWLNHIGLDDLSIRRIYNEMQQPGAVEEINGVLVPQTENWSDREAKMAFRAAIVEDVDNTIVTPGPERPLHVDPNMGMRLISQFRSFGYSSNTKTIMSGLQQGDMAALAGASVMLGLGMVSYYVYAVSAGGATQKIMENADLDKWLDEAIDRSGLLGIMAIPRDALSKIPATSDFVTFSESPLTRRSGQGLISLSLGPSFGAANEAANILMALDSPTRGTLHDTRQLMFYQNLFYFRRLLDAAENGLAEKLNLPDKRNAR